MSTPLRLIEHMSCSAGPPRSTATGPPCGTTLRRLVHLRVSKVTGLKLSWPVSLSHSYLQLSASLYTKRLSLVQAFFDC